MPTRTQALRPIHSAALLEGPGGVSLHLHGDNGALTLVSISLAALREIAALAGAALAVRGLVAQDRPPVC